MFPAGGEEWAVSEFTPQNQFASKTNSTELNPKGDLRSRHNSIGATRVISVVVLPAKLVSPPNH